MINLDNLHQSLKKSQAPTPSDESSSQEHFDKISTYIEQEKISEAANLIEKSFLKGGPDIRLIVYYCYAHFHSHGIKSFLEVFPTLTTILNEQWANLLPINRKEKQVQNSLDWLLSNILNKLKYCEKLLKERKTHPIWEKSVNGVTSDEIEKLIEVSAEFSNFFCDKWPKSPTKERVVHLAEKIKGFKPLIIEDTPNAETEEIPEVPLIEEEKHEELVEEVNEAVEESYLKEETEPLPACAAEEPEPTYSYENMEVLLSKLKMFKLLIEKNDYVKAALVAKDIDHLIESFDPLKYFPKLFSQHFALIARHVPALSVQWKEEESLQLKYLEKLYQTDLDKFLEW